jgi:intracellular septation protein
MMTTNGQDGRTPPAADAEAVRPRTPVGGKHPGWLGPALDFGPLLAFFVAYKIDGVFIGTAAFMAAIAAAVAISKWKLGRVSPMLWISAVLVIGFGGLTIWTHDQRFIQYKPTIIYILLAALLFGGLLLGRPTLKYILEYAYDGLNDSGWMKLTRNWAWFFVAMAVLNEVLRASLSFDTWLTVKVWGVTALSLLFAAANVPMLMRHGLGRQAVEEPPVPPQG